MGKLKHSEKEVRNMDMSNQDYQAYVKAKAKPSRLWRNMVWAFLWGGLICVIGQALTDLPRGGGGRESGRHCDRHHAHGGGGAPHGNRGI